VALPAGAVRARRVDVLRYAANFKMGALREKRDEIRKSLAFPGFCLVMSNYICNSWPCSVLKKKCNWLGKWLARIAM